MRNFSALLAIASCSILPVASVQAQSPAGSVARSPAKPSPTPVASPTVSPVPTPSPAAGSDDRPRVGGPLKSQAQKLYPRRIEPMESPSAQPGSSASPAKPNGGTADTASPSTKIRPRPQGIRRRVLSPPPTSQAGEMSPAASPAPTASPTPVAPAPSAKS
jgi:hypothetical protein